LLLAGNDDDDDDDDGNGGWAYLRDEEVYQEWIKPFDEQIGYRGDTELSSDSRSIDFLSLFLTDDFWSHITMETNRYAHQYLGSHELMPSSRFHEWYDVTVPEMKAFLSLHLSMGLVHKSEIEDYWAEFWPTFTPGFGKVMSRNRFEIILSFFHFANNDEYVERGQPGYDRLFKVCPIIDLIIPRFSAVYGPRKQLSLDEMTIAFKGKSTLKMYNPNKPDKYGYKAFVLSEAKSGYVLQWSLYTGHHGDEVTDLGATHVLVRQLMAQHKGKGHELYMDSYYTSPAVANELANEETGLCGTVSSQRRGMPKALRKTELPLTRGVDPCAWHDVKRFHLLSTLHGNSCVRKRIRSKHTDSGFRDINRPVCVDRYNSFMGGVDTADQRMKTYLFPHRSKKWYNRIVNAILSITMVNAHIIYCSMTAGPHKPLKAFVQDIITSLLEGFSKRENKIRGRRSAEGGEMPQRLTELHWLRDTGDRPDCIVCSDRTRPKGRHQTQYRCNQCGVGLCAVPCNERFHTLTNYKQCHLDR
uniref:PiggyBac transposable element-derived protein domain-containing protein n=1 Tax=Sander lucioperca TaxID=283035 RepID=A0A8D0A9A2_SANLU